MFIAQHIVISVKCKTPCFYGHTTSGIDRYMERVVRKTLLKKGKGYRFQRDRERYFIFSFFIFYGYIQGS